MSLNVCVFIARRTQDKLFDRQPHDDTQVSGGVPQLAGIPPRETTQSASDRSKVEESKRQDTFSGGTDVYV